MQRESERKDQSRKLEIKGELSIVAVVVVEIYWPSSFDISFVSFLLPQIYIYLYFINVRKYTFIFTFHILRFYFFVKYEDRMDCM